MENWSNGSDEKMTSVSAKFMTGYPLKGLLRDKVWTDLFNLDELLELLSDRQQTLLKAADDFARACNQQCPLQYMRCTNYKYTVRKESFSYLSWRASETAEMNNIFTRHGHSINSRRFDLFAITPLTNELRSLIKQRTPQALEEAKAWDFARRKMNIESWHMASMKSLLFAQFGKTVHDTIDYRTAERADQLVARFCYSD